MATHQLKLRPAVIGGETKPDDYSVIWDRIIVGRIFMQMGVGGRMQWSWSAHFPHRPQHAYERGLVSDLEEAKRRFKVAWSAIEADLTDEDIRRAREQEENTKNRPWNRR